VAAHRFPLSGEVGSHQPFDASPASGGNDRTVISQTSSALPPPLPLSGLTRTAASTTTAPHPADSAASRDDSNFVRNGFLPPLSRCDCGPALRLDLIAEGERLVAAIVARETSR
jgi:hypothetical protein